MAATTTDAAAGGGLVLLLLSHLAVAVVVAGDPLLLACGAPAAITLPDGRVFLPDSNVSISPAHASRATTTTASSPLYSTARAFSAEATYSLPVPRSPHRHLLLRLHFPQPAQFAVAAGDLELVSGARPASRATTGRHRYREYLLPHRGGGGLLRLRVSPRPGSLALLSAVELLPAPDALLPLPLSPPEPFRLAQTCYRVNAGAASGEASLNDSFWRLWEGDAAYLLNPAAARSVSVDPASVRYPAGGAPPYAAPAAVYADAQEMADAGVGNQRFNLSWAFPVDPGFRYSVRLHLCDIVGRNSTDLVFDVYINGGAVLSSFDLSGKLGLFNAYFVDFIADAPPGSEKILLQLGPPRLSYSKPNAILNGVEIMKLGDREAVRRVDALNTAQTSKAARKKKIAVVTAATAGGATLIAICIAGTLLLLRHRRRGKKQRRSLGRPPSSSIGLHTHTGVSASKVSAATRSHSRPSSGPSLSIGQIRRATGDFDEGRVVGVGGFGKVYRGVLENGTAVAVKRGNPRSQQGLQEFRTEIEMLSRLRHRHLVSLIGYCHEDNEMALVYEFMAGGPLRSHLYGAPGALRPLSWKQRLEACIGAAKGLHYLHTGVSETIIHRDVKTTNILLDGNLSAKISDFGLSMPAPAAEQAARDVGAAAAAAVKGSFGYLDPDYLRRQTLTDKSDVYSFGVVLLEVLCARPAVDPALPREQASLVDWAMPRQRLGELERVMDPRLAGGVGAASLRKFGETAEKCLAEYGADRPAMGDVLWSLERALRLQEAFLSTGGEGSSSIAYGGQGLPGRVRPVDGDAEDGADAGVATRVFSQILDPRGR
ncbi:receptor-like protein kinase THESEUS 1 [Triticum dicoccoides]|uniref:receptor-like protein kinase THESEUS 1 n=1 Tax=Triticum dicoccoides TaxID=85692 RepID=UPI00188E91B1|nr:receptor-like protein kinase THESEUS 1 [Triticum dicoccoides]